MQRLLVFLLIACSTGSKASALDLELLLAGPPSTGRSAFVNQLVSGEESGGKVLFFANEVPVDAVRELVRAKPGVVAIAPAWAVAEEAEVFATMLQTPALFPTIGEYFDAQNSIVGDAARSEISNGDVVALALWASGPRAMVLPREIGSLSDLIDLPIAAGSAESFALLTELGANPVQLVGSERIVAVLRGEVAGVELSAEQIGDEVLGQLSGGTVLGTYGYGLGVAVAQTDWWLNLAPSDQNALFDALAQAESANLEAIYGEVERLAAAAEEAGLSYMEFSSLDDGTLTDFAVETLVSKFGETGRHALQVKEDLDEIRNSPRAIDESDRAPDQDGGSFNPIAYFVTDRGFVEAAELSDRFLAAEDAEGNVRCGRLDFSLTGVPEIGVYDGRVDLEEGSSGTGEADCVELLAQGAEAANGRLIFMIPGYANSFDTSVKRGVAVLRDTRAPAPLVVWSWPSKGRLLNYEFDEGSVTWSLPHFKQFVLDLVEDNRVERIDIIAHSMGNRFPVALMADRVGISGSQFVFVAPDVSKSSFVDGVRRIPSGTSLTLYATKNDYALSASMAYNDRDRAGLTQNMILLPNLDTVDLSEFDWNPLSSFSAWMYGKPSLNHHHALEQQEALEDLREILESGTPAHSRNLRPEQRNGMPYYVVERRPS